ncbi:MAG: hypothetical protein JXA92_05855 [candidate division Zixibacteria bacterium]|nr:hypothetical protein [candidate division Zixibacteria bacterium]
MQKDVYKQCQNCLTRLSIDEIINSPAINPVGMTFREKEPGSACYLFEHNDDNCGATFSVDVNDFLPYITEDIPIEKLIYTDKCNGYCYDLDDIDECHDECYYAPFRRFLFKMIALKGRPRVIQP